MTWSPCFPWDLMNSRKLLERLGSIGLVAVTVILLDQGSKYLAIQLLEDRRIVSLFNDCLRFLLVENRGGFLSLGASLTDGARNLIFLLLTSVFLIGFFVYTLFDDNTTSAGLIASSMIIGGGTGNLIDRGFRDGAVVDFVNVGLGSLRTGIFNFADMAVLIGCLLLFFSLLPVKRSKMVNRDQEDGNG